MSSRLRYAIVFFCIIQLSINSPLRYPETEMEHIKTRDNLIAAEKEFEHRNWDLTENETIVDHFLSYLKWEDKQFFGSLGFPPSRPIEKVLDAVQKRDLYKHLRSLPKGGNLHSHEDHQLSKRILFDIVWESEDFDNLYIVLNESSPDAWMMDFFIYPPTNDAWVKVKNSNYSKKELLKKNTLIGLLTEEATNNPTISTIRWNLINPLWGRASVQLISNINIKKKYLWKMLEQSMCEGVSYMETRRSFGLDLQLYQLDPNERKTFGKKFIDPDYDLEVTLAQEVAKNFSAANPTFIDLKRISYAVRFLNFDLFNDVKNRTMYLRNKYPSHVLGLDLVAEEDGGYSHLYFLDQLLSLSENGKSKIPLYFHSSETSWPDDLITSTLDGELVPTLQNAYETVIFNAKRIGHGKGFVKKPLLWRILKDTKTAVEVCVVSNQILGMDPDIRNHYGQILYKEGVPIVLAPDDPGTFGYDNVTVDWYMAYLGWGLNLGDLKQLALNSLLHSGMEEEEKKKAIDEKWMPSWTTYISSMASEACKHPFNLSVDPLFYRILPRKGIPNRKIHIFGRNFEKAICKSPKCIFGDITVNATYVSNHELTCIVPQCAKCDEVKLKVHLILGEELDTGFTFKFDHTIVSTSIPTVSTSISTMSTSRSHGLHQLTRMHALLSLPYLLAQAALTVGFARS